jgi:hypothetical protein
MARIFYQNMQQALKSGYALLKFVGVCQVLGHVPGHPCFLVCKNHDISAICSGNMERVIDVAFLAA